MTWSREWPAVFIRRIIYIYDSPRIFQHFDIVVKYCWQQYNIFIAQIMGEKRIGDIEGSSTASSTDTAPEQRFVSFREDPFQAHLDWLERNMGEEAIRRNSEKIVKFMLRAEAKWQVGVMKILINSNTERGDNYFDKTREIIVGLAHNLPEYSLFKDQGETKQSEIQRWLLSTYIKEILVGARGDDPSAKSMRGIAWSLLAKDGRRLLVEREQEIDPQWLFDTMRPLIQANSNPKTISEELSRFSQGDEKIIRDFHREQNQ